MPIVNSIVMLLILSFNSPFLVLYVHQDPDDEIIANLASLKNGVAMRLVLGDLDWQIRSEPWEYTYATYCKEELPHKEQEAAMLLEVRFQLILLPMCGRNNMWVPESRFSYSQAPFAVSRNRVYFEF